MKNFGIKLACALLLLVGLTVAACGVLVFGLGDGAAKIGGAAMVVVGLAGSGFAIVKGDFAIF